MSDSTARRRKPISVEEFNDALLELLAEASPAELFGIPGMYEIISEAWNNEAIERAEQNRAEQNRGEG